MLQQFWQQSRGSPTGQSTATSNDIILGMSSRVVIPSGDIKIVKVESATQQANYLT
jgi:hypothetical protein